jgi:hypothetical protein
MGLKLALLTKLGPNSVSLALLGPSLVTMAIGSDQCTLWLPTESVLAPSLASDPVVVSGFRMPLGDQHTLAATDWCWGSIDIE